MHVLVTCTAVGRILNFSSSESNRFPTRIPSVERKEAFKCVFISSLSFVGSKQIGIRGFIVLIVRFVVESL
jgi:hypothetical protein